MTPEELTDWSHYRACSKICRARAGQPCFSLSSRVSGGRPDNVLTPLAVPHRGRPLRSQYAK